MAQLTPQQVQQYFASEGKKANPLSPLAWLAKQTKPKQTVAKPTKPSNSQGQPREGDTRINPQTGQQESFNPLGQWIPVTSQEQLVGTGESVAKPAQTSTASPFYTESGTGRRVSNPSEFRSGFTYFESGTGRQLQGPIAPKKDVPETAQEDTILDVDTTQDTTQTNTPQTDTDQNATTAFLDELIALNPFIQEQLKDPVLKAKWDALPANLKPMYYQVLQQLGNAIESGKVVNPNIEITPAKMKEFLDTATTELDPYYKEQMSFIKQDLTTSLSRMQEDFEREAARVEEPFKERLASQAEAEAQAGTAFGSERGVRERRIVQEQQRSLDDALRESMRAGEDVAIQAERRLGSDAFAGTTSPLLPQFQVSPTGITEQGRKLAFTPQGGLMGDIPKQREVAIRGRSSELEEIERRQRALDVSKL